VSDKPSQWLLDPEVLAALQERDAEIKRLRTVIEARRRYELELKAEIEQAKEGAR